MILGVDPASTTTGLAIVSYEGNLVAHMLSHGRLPSLPAMNLLRSSDIDVAIIESQYIGVNKRSAVLVAQSAGVWAGFCHALGIEILFVDPSTWQAELLGASPMVKRKERKQRAKDFVLAQYSQHLSPDAADAACIATHHLRRQHHESERATSDHGKHSKRIH